VSERDNNHLRLSAYRTVYAACRGRLGRGADPESIRADPLRGIGFAPGTKDALGFWGLTSQAALDAVEGRPPRW
jgi:hypothetical protein